MLMMVASSTAITVKSPPTPGLTNARPISPPAQGAAKARPYCQGREPELAQQQDSQERFGRHDQPADEQVVEIERPQDPSGPDVWLPKWVTQPTGSLRH